MHSNSGSVRPFLFFLPYSMRLHSVPSFDHLACMGPLDSWSHLTAWQMLRFHPCSKHHIKIEYQGVREKQENDTITWRSCHDKHARSADPHIQKHEDL